MKHNSEICEIDVKKKKRIYEQKCWRLQPKDIFGRREKYILRCLEDSVLLDKARAATALNLAVPDVIAILKKHMPRAEINKSGRIMGEVRKVAKITMGVLSKDTILHVCLTSVESDDEVEETRVKETTFPEIEDNVDTPVTKQDYFDMGDLPPPPPPLPSLNESISNDFPPAPFIEMMGNMTVDMGTPLEGPQADEPLPHHPTQTASGDVQRVPMTEERERRPPLALLGCMPAMVSSCAGIFIQAYKTIRGNPWNCRHCH
uniref:Uncharacterized protein n=1 Tax=Magallana gigas TaxID=29159 RepID=A0A8W8MIU4_MAGGI